MSDLMQKAEDHAKASEHVKARDVYAQVLALEPGNPLALEGHRKATTAAEMEAAMEAMRAEEEDAAKAQERLAKEEEEMRKMRAIEDKLQVRQQCPASLSARTAQQLPAGFAGGARGHEVTRARARADRTAGRGGRTAECSGPRAGR